MFRRSKSRLRPFFGPGLVGVVCVSDLATSVLSRCIGTRWLTRWDKEIELLVKLGYYGLTTGRGQ
jgi:peroxin-10